jgi:hypothetical protein
LQRHEGHVQNGTKFRPKGLMCTECDLEHLRMLENGL